MEAAHIAEGRSVSTDHATSQNTTPLQRIFLFFFFFLLLLCFFFWRYNIIL
jgi:hypothetical protein